MIGRVPYTIDTKSIRNQEPAIPERSGYAVSWPAYTLEAGGVLVDKKVKFDFELQFTESEA